MDKEKKLTKEEIRTPDKMTLALDNFMEWIGKNIALVMGLVIVLLLIGGVFTAVDYFKTSKENELQAEMSKIEHKYTDKKTKYKEAASAELAAAKAPKKDAKAIPPVGTKASGDLEKDYGSEVAAFEGLVAKDPSSKAAQISAIYLAEIYSEYHQTDKGIEALNKVVPKNEASDVLSALATNLKAGLIADKGDCTQAVDIWKKVIDTKKADYLHDEAKLRSAVCFEKMNDNAKAEQFYTELSKNTASKDAPEDKAVTEDAKKYLRLLKIRTKKGT